MTFNVTLPALLSRLGWRLELVDVGDGFMLASGAKREVFIKLHPGKSFTRDAVEATKDRDIRIDVLANDNLIGGMTYRLDPDLSRPWNAGRPKDKDCRTRRHVLPMPGNQAGDREGLREGDRREPEGRRRTTAADGRCRSRTGALRKPMPDDGRFESIPNLKVVKATGIFRGVRQAGVARRTRGDAGATPGRELLRLSLDSWEAPIVFEVTAIERDAQGSTVYRGTAPRAAGSPEVIAILVEEKSSTSADAVGAVWRTEVTRSTEGSPPDSVLELRRDAD